MNNLVNYLIESGTSLSLLALVYLVFLRKETFFRANRLYLLFSVLFSLLLPLFAIPVFTPGPVVLPEVTVTPYLNLLETVVVTSHRLSGNIEDFVTSSNLVIGIYFIGVLLMSLLFMGRILQISQIIRKGDMKKENGYKLVHTIRETSPFSFLNYLFVPKNHQELPGFGKMLFHELEHIRQKHTYDILLLDILLVFQWFNPFIWLLKRAVRENHEYLVDQAVLKTGVKPEEYKMLLLSQVAGNQIYAASHFNYSLIKNRFKMMSKIPSRKLAGIKITTGILIAFALVFIFACEQKKSNSSKEQVTGSLTISYDGDSLRISGNPEKVREIATLLRSGNVEMNEVENPDKSGALLISPREAEADQAEDSLMNPGQQDSGDDRVFKEADIMPVFPGGDGALLKFIGGSVKYPDEAVKNKIQGKVIITFVVSKDGSVKNAKVVRGVSPLLDAEALRVVNSLPKWTPGKVAGKNVNVAYTIPISFVLQ